MTEGNTWLADLDEKLPRHGEVVTNLARAVEACDRWRWLMVGCSLGSGRGDELSDIDAGIGHAEPLSIEELEHMGVELVAGAGEMVDVLVHHLEGWRDATRRFAAEYANGVQLDLVIYPAHWRVGSIRNEEVSIVDKDGNLAGPLTSHLYGAPDARLAREWVMLGWWAVSDIAKYVRRGSLFEAAARVGTVREHALRLAAAAGAIPYSTFGLTSLLDFPPFELPDHLADTYCVPDDQPSVVRAALAVADLLSNATARATAALGQDLSTPWSVTARARLDAAAT